MFFLENGFGKEQLQKDNFYESTLRTREIENNRLLFSPVSFRQMDGLVPTSNHDKEDHRGSGQRGSSSIIAWSKPYRISDS
jgi:hypothetical protein